MEDIVLTNEEKQLLKDVFIYITAQEPEMNYSSSFSIRFSKYDFEWDRFIRGQIDTDSSIPSEAYKLVDSIRIPFEDLPLYINGDSNTGKFSSNFGYGKKFKNIIIARLKLGR